MASTFWHSAVYPFTFLFSGLVSLELIQNGGFEHDGWEHWDHCESFRCSLVYSDDPRFGPNVLKARHRSDASQGPSQRVHLEPDKMYRVQSWFHMLNDRPGKLGETVKLVIDLEFSRGHHSHYTVATRPITSTHDGWVFLQGHFKTPDQYIKSATFRYEGPVPHTDFLVDQASITEVKDMGHWRSHADASIDKYRKSDVNITVHVAHGMDRSNLRIRVVQTAKSFPFGTAVNSVKYVDPSQRKYQDFIHTHFNWAVLENALTWRQLEPKEGHMNYDGALKTINGLRQHGLKVRGHSMVSSVSSFVPDWLKSKSKDDIRHSVHQHIERTLNTTRGLLEHWDVNNENLHGQWFQEQLNDRDYDLELFRMMHHADHHPKLFLNDYDVVADGTLTGAYREQGLRYKNASVHLYGMGVQSHFGHNEPNPTLIRHRLDTLAEVGLPLWATELDVQNDDENVRADWYEHALRALYGHPAIEGIMFWGFWGDVESSGQAAALVTGHNLELTAAGRRVLDLLENQWMTDETHVLSQSGDHFTVRGFHGDYELHVMYQGHELSNLRQNFTLDKHGKSLIINAHT